MRRLPVKWSCGGLAGTSEAERRTSIVHATDAVGKPDLGAVPARCHIPQGLAGISDAECRLGVVQATDRVGSRT
jgi:hypothetical protein